MKKQVYENRHLDVELFDDIDHALGRPRYPMQNTYRDYFECGTKLEALALKSSGFFEGRDTFLRVTQLGRQALSKHLAEILS